MSKEVEKLCGDMNVQLDIITDVISELRFLLDDVSNFTEPPENGVKCSVVTSEEWNNLRLSEAQIARACEIRARLLRIKKAARSCTMFTIHLQSVSREKYTEALGNGVLNTLYDDKMTAPFTIEDVEDIMPDSSTYARQHRLMMQDLNRAMSEL